MTGDGGNHPQVPNNTPSTNPAESAGNVHPGPSTPPNQSPLTDGSADPNSGSTPRTSRSSHGMNAQTQSLLLSRYHLRRDMGSVQVVDIGHFGKRVLPKIAGIDLDVVTDEVAVVCRNTGLIKQSRWVKFRRDPSKMLGKHENEVFAPLKDLYDHIVRIAEARDDFKLLNLRADDEFFRVQDNTGQSERGNTARPDVIFKSKVTMMVGARSVTIPAGSYFWCDVIAFLEYRRLKRWEDLISNFDKILWNGNHCFTMDPCRRAVYSASIEDSYMRLWCFTRAGCIVSTPFLWIRAHSTVIRIILSLSFASKAARGYDPNMDRRWIRSEANNLNIQYEIKCGEYTFVTTGSPLSDYRANLFIGRATRVYRVYLLGDRSREFALKLAWPAIGSQCEDNILDDIVARVKPEKRRFFLTYFTAGYQKVRNENGDLVDDTTELFIPSQFKRTGWYPAQSKPRRNNILRTVIPGSSRAVATGAIYSTPEHVPLSTLMNNSVVNVSFFQKEYFVPRIQYYIVYNEIGTPLHGMDNFRDVLLALTDATYGLEALHEAGYVHRDISTGNILCFKRGDGSLQVRLSDFEYSKRRDSNKSVSTQVKTGTLQFMPVEMQLSKYLFWSGGRIPAASAAQTDVGVKESSSVNTQECITGNSANAELENLEAEFPTDCELSEGEKAYLRILAESHHYDMNSAKQKLADPKNNPPDKYPPVYNCFHDMESFYWILLWFLLYHVPTEPLPDKEKKKDELLVKQLEAAHRVFTEHDDMDDPPRDRLGCLTLGAVLNTVADNIPTEFGTITATVKAVRGHMQHAYEEAERPFETKLPFPITAMPRNVDYTGLVRLFRDAAATLTKEKPLPFKRIKAPNVEVAFPEVKEPKINSNKNNTARASEPERSSQRLVDKATAKQGDTAQAGNDAKDEKTDGRKRTRASKR